ncbi:MAG: gliding motility-associated C-terminal domain-containing protein [Taibaiella sp.]
MKKKYLLSLISLIHILITVPASLKAQGENNNWHFGQKMGIDFNQNPPQFFESNIRTGEGCSSVSDASGNLLFYTMGARIWDRNGNEMPNATGLLGNGPAYQGVHAGSSAYGVAIIPHPGNANQYFVFSGDAIEDATNKLYYSLVDMTLNGGMGDVVPTVKNVLLMTNVYEYLSTTRGGDCKSYWLLARTSNMMTREFYAFKVDANGVAPTPVITVPPQMALSATPQTCFAADGVTMVSSGLKLVLSRFNNLTGEVYDFVGIDGIEMGPVAFSPDASKVYIAANNWGVLQYDLSLMPNTAAVAASKMAVDSNHDDWGPMRYHDVRLGPDGRMYIVKNTFNPGIVTTISVINNPDVVGTGCNFIPEAFTMPPSWLPPPPLNYFFCFGNRVAILPPADTVYHPAKDTLICSGTLQLESSDEDATIFEWSTGAATGSINVSQPGLYWVRGTNNCSMTTDTFNVQFANIAIDLGNDTAICTGKSITLNATGPDISNYNWNNGSTNATLEVSQAGTYYVTGSLKDCIVSDTILISITEPELYIVENDTTICNDQPLTLHAQANPVSTYSWSNGDQDYLTVAATAGTYTVTATNECGTYQDSVQILVQNCDCKIFAPNAFSPNGDGKNDTYGIQLACQPSSYSLSIYNRYGQRLYQTTSPTATWNGTFNGQLLDAGTYFYYITIKGPTGTEFEQKGDIMLIR